MLLVREFIFLATWPHFLPTPCSNDKSLFPSLYFPSRGLMSFGIRVPMANTGRNIKNNYVQQPEMWYVQFIDDLNITEDDG